MLPRTLLFGITAGFLLGECVFLPVKDFGRLEVVAVDITGKQIPIEQVRFYESQSSQNLNLDRARLPYGHYRIRVDARGFYPAWREVSIGEPLTVVRLPLDLGVECGPARQRIGGRILGLRNGDELWVKAVPVRGLGGEEARVDSKGGFHVGDLPIGDYVLLVLRGDAVVHQEMVRNYPNATGGVNLSIDLTK